MDWTEIRDARRKRGLSQAELAEKVGVTQGAVSQIERGQSKQSLTLRRIEQVLEGRESSNEPASSATHYDWPPVSELSDQLVVGGGSIQVDQWQRGADGGPFGGDFLVSRALPDRSTLLVLGDVVGHGRAAIPARFWLEGWLDAWMSRLPGAPRLEFAAREVSEALDYQDIEAAVLFVLLSPGASRFNVTMELLSCGFPLPLLLSGDRQRAQAPGEVGPGLPLAHEGQLPAPALIRSMTAPWRLVLASDGLLSRLGVDDAGGRAVLRRWQSGADRDRPPAEFLNRGEPADDEFFALLTFAHWDDQTICGVLDLDAAERFPRALEMKYAQNFDRKRTERFAEAVREAICNVRCHAYDGEDGTLRCRLREEFNALRVEIEDESPNPIDPAAVSSSERGFRVMRKYTDQIEVRAGRSGGNVVTLIMKRRATDE